MPNVTMPTFSPAECRILAEHAKLDDLRLRIAKAAEETAELSAALSRLLTGHKSLEEVAGEFADTLITMQQLCNLLSLLRSETAKHLHAKVRKLALRLEMERREKREVKLDAENSAMLQRAKANADVLNKKACGGG